MKKLFLFAAVICAAVFSSCEYDDTALRNDLDGLKDRVTALETTLNNEVAALKALINGKNCVTGVTERDGGYKLTFSDGTSITISNGQDGADGTVIGVKEVDGVVYWTIDGEVTDYAVTGNDGATPEFKDGKWYINGEVVGTAQGDSIFKAVEVDEENNVVTFTLQDGSTFEVALVTDAKYENLSSLTFIPEYSDGKITVSYTSAADATVTVKYLVAPAAMADVIAANKAEAALVAVYTKTRAEAGATVKLPITSITAEESVITVVASAKDLSAEFFAGTQEASINFGVADALSSYMTDFIPAYANELFAASAAAQGYQGAKLTWNKYSKAATYKVSYEGFTSEAVEATEYVFAEETLKDKNFYDFTVTAYDAAGNAVAEATAKTEVYTLCNWTEPDFELQVQEDGTYKLIAHNLTNFNYAYGGAAATDSGKSTIEIYKGDELQYTLVNSTGQATLKAWAGYKRWALNAQDDRYEWTWTGINNSGSEVKTVPASWFAPGEYTIKYKIGYVVNKNGTWATSNNGFIPQAEKAGATHIYFSNGLADVLQKGGDIAIMTQEGTSSETFVIEAPVTLNLVAAINDGTVRIQTNYTDGHRGFKAINGIYQGAKLSWGALTKAASYDVYYKASTDATWIKKENVTTNAYTFETGTLTDLKYDFKVVALDASNAEVAAEETSAAIYTMKGVEDNLYFEAVKNDDGTWGINTYGIGAENYSFSKFEFDVYEAGSTTALHNVNKDIDGTAKAWAGNRGASSYNEINNSDYNIKTFNLKDGTTYDVKVRFTGYPQIFDAAADATDFHKHPEWHYYSSILLEQQTVPEFTVQFSTPAAEVPAIDWDFVMGNYTYEAWESPYHLTNTTLWGDKGLGYYSKLYGVYKADELVNNEGNHMGTPKDGQKYAICYSYWNFICFDIDSVEINPETMQPQEGTGCYALINMIDRPTSIDKILENYSYYNKNEGAFYVSFKLRGIYDMNEDGSLKEGKSDHEHTGKLHSRVDF